MDKIKIKITGRAADVVSAPEIVADNAEYEIEFAVNERDGWNPAVPMTALFVRRDARYTAVVMDAGETTCTMPPQTGSNVVYIGLTQEELRTTTPARIAVHRSVRTMTDFPPLPDKDVYAQILANFAGLRMLSGQGAPTTETVGKVNQLYRDEDNNRIYVCVDDANGYTWAMISSSGSGGTVVTIDTTLSKAGQAADAKAVGDALADKADAAAVNSALANKADSATLTTELAKKANTTDIPSVPAWALAASKPTYTAAEVGALPNTTAIPDVSGKLDKAQGTANAGKFMGVGSDGNITPVDKPTYTLPVATANVLGGVKPVEKTTAMTQDVGVDSVGKLYTAPSSGGSDGTDKSLGITSATVGQIAKITAVDDTGKPTTWEAVDMPSGGDGWEIIQITNVTGEVSSFSQTISSFNSYQQVKAIIEIPMIANTSAKARVGFVFGGKSQWFVYNCGLSTEKNVAIIVDLFIAGEKIEYIAVAGTIMNPGTMYGTEISSLYTLRKGLIDDSMIEPADLSGIRVDLQNTTTDYLTGANIMIYGVKA